MNGPLLWVICEEHEHNLEIIRKYVIINWPLLPCACTCIFVENNTRQQRCNVDTPQHMLFVSTTEEAGS